MNAKRVVSALALGFLLVTGACGSSDGEEASLVKLEGTNPVRVSSRGNTVLELTPTAPIKLGKNMLRVTFPADEDAELVSASTLMPAHGHGSAPPTIEPAEGGGFMMRDLVFFMSGRWEVRLEIRVAGRDDEAIVAVDVP